jgi:hypothetical protein
MGGGRQRASLFSNFEIPSSPTDNLSIQQLMMATAANFRQEPGPQLQQLPFGVQPHNGLPQQPAPALVVASQLPPAAQVVREQAKPVKLEDKPVKLEAVKLESEMMDVDMYDDVLQCVYDDVDTKYDVVLLSKETDTVPPIPPARKQRTASVGRPAPPTPETETCPDPDPEKPLPDTPSKNFLSKLSVGNRKSSTVKELEEQKKREKAEKEAEKQREKEEKEREKALKKQEEQVSILMNHILGE